MTNVFRSRSLQVNWQFAAIAFQICKIYLFKLELTADYPYIVYQSR
ncbi:MAG: hypothetical protein ACK5RE_02600 [Pseudanabaena sp.]